MSLTVKLELPPEIEERLRETTDLAADVKEAYAVDLFRRGQVTHIELGRILGLDRYQTDACLRRHNVFEGSLTMSDLDADQATLRQLLDTPRE